MRKQEGGSDNELTPAETPTDTKPAPVDRAARLRAVASGLPPASPGVRGHIEASQSDYSVTSKIERLPSDMTPAPLPPSPAADAADTWFEQVPTNPAAVPDLAALSGSHPDLATPPNFVGSRPTPRPGALDPWQSSALYNQPEDGATLTKKQWLIPTLIAATALVIGMVFGALLFGGGSGSGSDNVETRTVVPTIEQCKAVLDKAAPKPDQKKKSGK